MSLSKTAVNKPVTILIIFIILAALSVYSTMRLPIDMLPDMELPYIAIITQYENAGPEEVERSISRRIESVLSGISGLKTLSSQSSTGSSTVFLELNQGTDLNEAMAEVRDNLDIIKGFLPEEAESPIIIKMDPSMIPIMSFVITGNRTPEELYDYAEDVIQPRLEQIDGVASANIIGGREKAIIINIPRDRLQAYSLTINQISQMIAAQNIQASGGTIDEGDTEYSIETSGQFTSVEDVKNTVISYKTEVDGTGNTLVRKILLRDIADVYDGYKDVSSLAYWNGAPCVMLSIQKQSGKNSVQTAEQALARVEEIRTTLPSDISIEVGMDTTEDIKIAISNILDSVIQGAVLAVIILFIFLRSIKSTIIIGVAIPLSLIITLGIMYFTGFTLNLMTLAGLSLGVGMLVDNSIVILENIYSYRAKGAKPTVAAVLGSQEMLLAIVASTLTTVCVFLPLIMYGNDLGIVGQLFSGLTFTVVFCLMCSLIVAIVFVPVLSSKYLKLENIANRRRSGLLGTIDNAMTRFFDGMDNGYASGVRFVLKHKLIIAIILGLMFIGSIIMIPVIGFILTPDQESNSVRIDLEMPKGTRLEATDAVIREFDALVRESIVGLKSTTISVGSSGMMGSSSGNTASLTINVWPSDEREPGWDGGNEAEAKARALFDRFPGADFTVGASSNGMSGNDIDVLLKSNNLDNLRAVATQIRDLMQGEELSQYITDVQMDLEDGLPQVQLVIDRARMYDLGVTIATVSSELNGNINGQIASTYQDEDGDDIDIVVRLPEEDRARIADIEQIFVTNSAGQRIPLSSFAHYEETTSPVTINREDQTRAVHITAKQVNKNRDSTDFVQRQVDNAIRANVILGDDMTLSYAGNIEDLNNMKETFIVIIIMAIALVFAVMASQFESFIDPFIILFTIPLSLIGVISVYLIMGNPLNVMTAVGMLILVGIIVNNGIVLVDYTNLLRKRGLELREACIEACRNRLRPILMTTLTTVLGLIPMAFFPGEGSEMTQPIGQTVLGGLTFGTTMTLFFMPIVYYAFNRARERLAARKAKRRERRQIKRQQAVAAVFPSEGVSNND